MWNVLSGCTKIIRNVKGGLIQNSIALALSGMVGKPKVVRDGLVCNSTAIYMSDVLCLPEVREESMGSSAILPLFIWAT